MRFKKYWSKKHLCVYCYNSWNWRKKIKKKNWLTPKKGIFELWNKNVKNLSSYFSFVFTLKIIDAQMLFLSVFLKTHKKTVINRQKRPKWRFWQSITFFVRFQKYRSKDGKRKLHANFHKNIIWAPWNFLKRKTLTLVPQRTLVPRRARVEILELYF